MEDSEAFGSGVGVLDKAALVLSALEAGPAPLAQLVATTGLARPTAHRLAVALEYHRFVARDMQGRFVLGPRLQELASSAGEDRLLAAAMPVLVALRNHTKESTQLFRLGGGKAGWIPSCGCEAQRGNPPSFSAAKATSESALQLPNARWAFATPFP